MSTDCMHYRHDPSKPHGSERDLLSPASRGRDDNAQRGDPACGGHTAAQRQSWGPTQAAGPKARAPALTRLPTARDSWRSGREQAWRPVLGARFGCGTSRAQARGLCLLRPVSPVCPFCCLLRGGLPTCSTFHPRGFLAHFPALPSFLPLPCSSLPPTSPAAGRWDQSRPSTAPSGKPGRCRHVILDWVPPETGPGIRVRGQGVGLGGGSHGRQGGDVGK